MREASLGLPAPRADGLRENSRKPKLVGGDCDTGQVAADAADRFCGCLVCGMDDV
jgi:hypothetical protein